MHKDGTGDLDYYYRKGEIQAKQTLCTAECKLSFCAIKKSHKPNIFQKSNRTT